MLRHFNILSRHKTKLKGKKLCRDKEISCRDIFQEQQRMTIWLHQSFYVATQDTFVVTITRQLQQNFVTTFSNYIVTKSKKKA